MMDYLDQKRESDTLARERADECGICGAKFGVGLGKVRKARGQVDKDQPGLASCLECAESIYGDTNIDGDPMADDDELSNRDERAEQAQLEAYYGGAGAPSITEQCDRDREESRRLHA